MAGGAVFGFLPVKMGLLLGAILHPVLFPLHINDIDSSVHVGLIQLVLIQLVLMILFYTVFLILILIH